MGRVRCQVGIFGGGQNGAVAGDFLHLEQIDACFDQVRGVGVAKTVGRDLFFIPQASTTLCRVICTPPRSSGAGCFEPALAIGKQEDGVAMHLPETRDAKVTCGKGTNRSLLPLASRI